MNPLDRPVWSSLTTSHLGLGEGGDLARRYLRDVSVFAAVPDESPEALDSLASMVRPGEQVFVLHNEPMTLPPSLTLEAELACVQMVSHTLHSDAGFNDIEALTDADAPEMQELVRLTEPGPFLARTHIMGNFFGVRINGRLIAMAGERMRFPGFTEISAVCTHPDFRGQGHGGRLSTRVAQSIRARGEVPFLHALKENTGAIRLYEDLGFEYRRDISIAVLEKKSDAC